METVMQHVEVWMVDERYQCALRYWKTELGEWSWSVMDIRTQHGLGGWTNSIEAARRQCESMTKVFKEDSV